MPDPVKSVVNALKRAMPESTKRPVRKLRDSALRRIDESRGDHLQASVGVFDDVFPNLLTGFRVAEFNAYLEHWSDAAVSSSAGWFPTAAGERSFEAAFDEYRKAYPLLAPRVVNRLTDARLGYCVFLHNIATYLPAFERRGLPFVFTLYPGGAFALTDACAKRLRRIVGSRFFRGMIVTQTITQQWLLERDLVDPELLWLLWGVVVPDEAFRPVARRREGPGLSICFVANRYTKAGRDKGYDLFIDAAEIVAKALPTTSFHVVGDWSAADYPVSSGLASRLTRYGNLVTPNLRSLYDRMDVIVSLSRPHVRSGEFDGFPLGAAVEAGLRGVAVLASDELHEGGPFRPGVELEVVELDAARIAERVIHLEGHPEELSALGTRAQSAFRDAYSRDRQIRPRIELLTEQLAAAPDPRPANRLR